MFKIGDTIRISTVPFSPDIRIPPGWEGETATIIGGPGDAGGGMQIWKVRGVSGAETWVHEANITPSTSALAISSKSWLILVILGILALAASKSKR